MIFKHPHRIEVSYSELSTWKTCRTKWYWGYGLNLEPRTQNIKMTVGKFGHIGMAAMLKREDWERAMYLASEELKKSNELWADEIEIIDDAHMKARSILYRYERTLDWKSFKVIGTEISFEVSVPYVKHKLIGIIDAVIEDNAGSLWIVEHKFPAQLRPIEDIEMSMQIGIYQYVMQKLKLPVVGTIYNQLIAKVPQLPQLNKNGSMSRTDIACDWETYRAELLRNRLEPSDYHDMEEKLNKKIFFHSHRLYRSQQQVKVFGQEIAAATYELVRTRKSIFMSESAINCRSCQFRELCMEVLRGRDPIDMIEAAYKQRESKAHSAGEETNGSSEGGGVQAAVL